jgi:hypothetical protein
MTKSNGLVSPSPNHVAPMTAYLPVTTTAVARTGVPRVGDILPSAASPTPSRVSANSSLAAPTAQASAQLMVLIAAPVVMTSPTQLATYHRGQRKCERDSTPHCARGGLRGDVDRRRGRHHPHRDANGLLHAQLSTKTTTFD